MVLSSQSGASYYFLISKNVSSLSNTLCYKNINIGIVYDQQHAARLATVILSRSPTERDRVIPNYSDLPLCEQLLVQMTRTF